MKTRAAKAIGLVALAFAVAGYGLTARGADDDKKEGRKMATAEIKQAGNHEKKITGTVKFSEDGDGPVRVVVDLDGLSPGDHGIHIHEKGDLSAPDLKSAGGHFNPGHHKHAGPNDSNHHEGDWGNITADDNGHARMTVEVSDITLGTGKDNDVVGKSVIVHAKRDDLKSQPSGDSGDRIAGGVIKLDDKDKDEKK